MAVYVDPEGSSYGKIGRVEFVCHMIADTPAELHAMAEKIGLKRAYSQTSARHSYPHYDLSSGKRKQAIAAGAVAAARRDYVNVMRKLDGRPPLPGREEDHVRTGRAGQ